MSGETPFSWRASLRALRHPGPAPPGLPALAFVLVSSCVATVAVLVWLGYAWHDDSHHFFRERKLGTYLSFASQMAAAVVATLIGRRLRPASFARFWFAMAALLAWTAGDDLFVLHERVDRALHAGLDLDPDHPVTDRLDDLIVAGYGVAAVALAYRHRGRLASLPWTVLILAVASGLFALMVLADTLHVSKTLEDALKVLAGTLILVGFLAAWLVTPTPGGAR
jgi:hypothetical protein